jgi:hypothetical protein
MIKSKVEKMGFVVLFIMITLFFVRIIYNIYKSTEPFAGGHGSGGHGGHGGGHGSGGSGGHGGGGHGGHGGHGNFHGHGNRGFRGYGLYPGMAGRGYYDLGYDYEPDVILTVPYSLSGKDCIYDTDCGRLDICFENKCRLRS